MAKPLPILLLLLLSSGAKSSSFTFTNNCRRTIWPAALSGAGAPPLSTTGFSLNPSQSLSLPFPPSWSGRLWARTFCSTNQSTSLFSCATADCNSGQLPCSGAAAAPPATLAEFTLNASGNTDFFDVSLVDGFNLPLLISPSPANSAGGGRCEAAGCAVDINALCPENLRVFFSGAGEEIVACRSACEAFGKPEFCCSGEYGSPSSCKPSAYSEVFKRACPGAYSYAYDDATSTFTCGTGVDYVITFCPDVASQKAKEEDPQAAELPLINDTMVFLGPASGGVVASGMFFAAAAAFVAFWVRF